MKTWELIVIGVVVVFLALGALAVILSAGGPDRGPCYYGDCPNPPVYAATFTERGLPSGMRWGIKVAFGASEYVWYNSSNSSVSPMLQNGTYNFTIDSPVGYAAHPASGIFAVNGLPVNFTLTFNSTTLVLVSTPPVSEGGPAAYLTSTWQWGVLHHLAHRT